MDTSSVICLFLNLEKRLTINGGKLTPELSTQFIKPQFCVYLLSYPPNTTVSFETDPLTLSRA